MALLNIENLKNAATKGDVKFLKKCVASKKPVEFYSTFFPRDNPDVVSQYGNIFHLAIEENGEEFIREAIEILPLEDTQKLLLQPSDDENLWSPLHEAAKIGNIEIVKMFLDVYRNLPSLPSDEQARPWLLKNSEGQIPCYVALDYCHEICALELLRMDMELISNMTTEDGSGVLYNAVSNGFSKVALEILKSSNSFTCGGYRRNTPLHNVTKCTEGAEEICKLLLQREPKLLKQKNKSGENIFHSWADDCKVWPFKFLLESTDIIPNIKKDFIEMFTATTRKSGDNPLHNLVSYYQRNEERSLKVAKLLIETYKQEESSANLSDNQLPWLVQNSDGETPLSLAIERKFEKFAMYILSLDNDAVVNCQENALFMAIEKGCDEVAEKILEIIDDKGWAHLLINDEQVTALHLAPLCKKKTFFNRLLEGHPELIERVDKYGGNVLHHWLRTGGVWQLEDLLKSKWRSHITKLIVATDYKDQNNPLHVAATSDHEATHQVVKLLVDTYREENPDWVFLDLCWLPWFCLNKENEGPLHLAIRNKHEKLATYILSLHDDHDDYISELLNYYSPKHKTIFLAIENNCRQVAEKIFERLEEIIRPTKYLRDPSNGRNVLHLGPSCTDEEFGKWLLEKASRFITQPDKSGKTPLHEACDVGAPWFVQAIRINHPSAFNSAPLAWIKSCEKSHVSTIRAFIDYNPGKFRDLCIKHKVSPLHHIQLSSLTDYEEFLTIPRMNKDLLNLQNSKGATPLHTAIESRNILLTETLLSMEHIRYNIKDNNKKTATDLLAQVCKDETKWDFMCQRIRFDPYITTSYFQRKTNLLDVRNSLFVVAALLATITFTAGFTLPGGLNQDTGEAVLAKKAAFLVFMLSNTLAMCASMLVLICLVWSMVHSSSKSLVLIDRSMVILMVAFYSTLLAFMTGVYLVISSKVFWLAIVVIIMCSLIGISAYRTLLYKLLIITSRKQRDPMQHIEQGLPIEEQNPLISSSSSEESSTESSDSSSQSSDDSNEGGSDTEDSDSDDLDKEK